MFTKLSLAFVYALSAYLLYLNIDPILTWFRETANLSLVVLAATLLALIPVIPFPLVGGVIGAAFGPALGAGITWVASATASILMFLFVRYGYQDWGQKLLNRYKSLSKVTALFERNAFLAILFSRMLPFIPSIIVNVYAALSRVSVAAFIIASTVGKIPAMILFAWVGNNMVSEPKNMLITLGTYCVFLAITLSVYMRWQKNKRPAA